VHGRRLAADATSRKPSTLRGGKSTGGLTMRGILLWLIGIPIPIILLLWLFGVLS
jgi:hypothetical protein